jgi:hypothetical protein
MERIQDGYVSVVLSNYGHNPPFATDDLMSQIP